MKTYKGWWYAGVKQENFDVPYWIELNSRPSPRSQKYSGQWYFYSTWQRNFLANVVECY